MNTSQLVIYALEHACIDRKPEARLIFHSDVGSKYVALYFRKSLKIHETINICVGKIENKR